MHVQEIAFPMVRMAMCFLARTSLTLKAIDVPF